MTQSSGTQKINVAVVGLGFMGVTHLKAYLDHPLARVVAVCDASRLPVNGVLPGVAGNIKKSEDIRLEAGVASYRVFDEVLADPAVELVDICTPTPLHAEQVIAALNAGKHVLCEKPLARTSEIARKISIVAEQSSRVLMPAMCMRFWPGWSLLKQIVAEQTYGKVLAAHFTRLSEMPAWSRHWAESGTADKGGALFDLHIHDTDLVHFLFGKPAAVFSTGVTSDAGVIEHVMTQYQFQDGPAVSAEGSWRLASGFNMGYRLQCERATLEFDLSRGSEALRIVEAGQGARNLPCPGTDGYVGEISYLLECLVRGTPATTVTAADAVAALEICEAEERSLRTRQLVSHS